MINQLTAGLEQLDLKLTDVQLQQLLQYAHLLIKWNKSYNLTAPCSKEEIVSKHLLDSLIIARNLQDKEYILDLGTGAGLPGIPLAVSLPQKKFVLLDSNGKKTRFLTQVVYHLGLENTQVIQIDANTFKPAKYFDTVVSRAVTSLVSLFTTSKPLLDKKGHILAMKGKYPVSEIEEFKTKHIQPQPDIIVQPLTHPNAIGERHLVIMS